MARHLGTEHLCPEATRLAGVNNLGNYTALLRGFQKSRSKYRCSSDRIQRAPSVKAGVARISDITDE